MLQATMHEEHAREHRPVNNEPLKTTEYLQKYYWDNRFQKEEEYDWFKKFEEFSHLVLPKLSKSDRILVLGCGNSTLSFELHSLGFQDITSIDLSEVRRQFGQGGGLSSILDCQHDA